MTMADDIIVGRFPNFDDYIQQGESLDDIDEYGFTALIEAVITGHHAIVQALLDRGVDVNKKDVTGCSALYWAVDQADMALIKMLLAKGADPNAYNRAGLSILVYPILRGQNEIKNLLYQYGAKFDFAQDFISGKLLGHRFELKGDVDILNANNQFIELDYEGFILEFTVAMIHDSLRRFTSSYSTRAYRGQFHYMFAVMDGLTTAEGLLRLQHAPVLDDRHRQTVEELMHTPLLILPAASRGHALCFIRYQSFWAKIDRGENSLHEGCVNIYRMTKPQQFSVSFLEQFLYKKQTRDYFHQQINTELGLVPVCKVPIPAQIVGNCSWANVQALVAVAYVLQTMTEDHTYAHDDALNFYNAWVAWDQDRALDECISRFYSAGPIRRASLAAMLGAVLFQSCDEQKPEQLARAEKILSILMLPEYQYILNNYLQEYCVRHLTPRGNNLLKLLDDCGIDPKIGVNSIATGLGGARGG